MSSTPKETSVSMAPRASPSFALAWRDDRPEGAVFDGRIVSAAPGWKEMQIAPNDIGAATASDSFTGILCTITIAGEPTACRTLFVNGSPILSNVLFEWLEHPGLRFPPMALDGRPVIGRHIFYLGVKTNATTWGGSGLKVYPDGLMPGAAQPPLP